METIERALDDSPPEPADNSGMAIEPVGEVPAKRPGAPGVETWERVLRKWEDQINKGDGSAIRARWESGRRLVALKKGRQLPKKMLDLLAVHFGVARSELSARMKFAQKFSTEEELSKVIESCRTWFSIKQHALTDKPREKKTKKPTISALKRALELLENFDPVTADEDDVFVLDVIEACVHRYMNAIITLKDRRSERLNAMTVRRGSPIEAGAM